MLSDLLWDYCGLFRHGNGLFRDLAGSLRPAHSSWRWPRSFFPRFKERIPLRLEVAAVTVAAAFFAVFVIVEAAMAFQSISFGKPPNVNYMIVLSAPRYRETK